MEAIVNNLIKAIGWSIFHSLWQGAIIYGLLLLVVMAFPKLNSRIKHNLAYGAICMMFIAFCITFFSIFKLPASSGIAGSAAPTLTLNEVYYEYLSTLPQEISSRTEYVFPYLVSIYGIGLLFQLFILFSGYKKMVQLKNADRTPVPAEWATAFAEMTAQLRLRQHIGFYLSSKVNVPLVIGYFKPVVLFPIALATQLDLKQVEAILIHELSHIRRNDYLLNMIKTGIETLLFFNPFVWLSGKFINIEREHACDDLVLQFTGTPLTYAHALLKLEILKDKSAPALSMAATGKDQHLYQRIKRITDMKTNYMNVKQQIFTIALTVATVISLAWVKPSKAEKAAVISPETKSVEIGGLGIKFDLDDSDLKAANVRAAKLNADTTKKKQKFKIVTVDAKGDQHEYSSIKEMPDSLRKEMIRNTFISSDNFTFNTDSFTRIALARINSPEWKAKQAEIQKNAEEIRKRFDSPEWKSQLASIQKNAEEMRKKFDSPEWKAQQAEIRKNGEEMSRYYNSPEWKAKQADIQKSAEEIRKRFDSPEWKAKQAEILKNAEEMRKKFDSPEWKAKQDEIRKNAEEIRKKFDSPEWKAQQADIVKKAKEMQEYYNSPEFKKQVEEAKELQKSDEYQTIKKKFDADVNELKKKKGIKTNLIINNY